MREPQILPMTLDDYEDAVRLWTEVEGVRLNETDSREAVAAYLARNPGLSQVARDGDRIVGAVLCGHDGRRGYIYHLAVDPAWRRGGIARRLIEKCWAGLAACGIRQCDLHVLKDNETGRQFWEALGWRCNKHSWTMWRRA